MKLSDHLPKEQKQQLDKLKKEKLSERDLRELMGSNRDTFKRVRGAIQRK